MKPERIQISYQNEDLNENQKKEIHWYEITPKRKFSDTTYSNYEVNDMIIVEDKNADFGFESRKKVLLWILVIFIMVAAIGNAAYWSVAQ